MGLHLLHQGAHNTGLGAESHTFRANEPGNNIVESDEDLSKAMPEKFRPCTEDEAKAFNVKKRLKAGTVQGGKKTEILAKNAPGKQTAAASAPDDDEPPHKPEDGTEDAGEETTPSPGPGTPPEARVNSEEQPEAEPEDDGLGEKTVAQLRKVAEREEVEYTTSMHKDELIEAIRSHRSRTEEPQ